MPPSSPVRSRVLGERPARPEPRPAAAATSPPSRRAGWRPGIPFVLVHLACLAVLVVGWSPSAVAVCGAMYLVRIFAITAFYHRYFSHRSYHLSRGAQLAAALLGASAAQRGPLWWAAHHRRHHRSTDRPGDPHSPVLDGFWQSHLLWLFAPANQRADLTLVGDLAAFPELRVLDRFHHAVPVATAASLFAAGAAISHLWPGSHTSGLQMLVWGFCVSTVLLYHATFAINSFSHLVGSRRFETRDGSRNNWWLAVLTLGEGWHNNHHRFPSAARQGFAPWEIDLTWLGLRALARMGLASSLRPVPAPLIAAAARRRPPAAAVPDPRAP